MTVGLWLVIAALALGGPAWAASVSELLDEAEAVLRADDRSAASIRQAIALYQRAGAIEPGNVQVQFRLADAAIEGGDVGDDAMRWYQLAEQAAERAVALEARSAQAYFLLAATRGKVAREKPILEVSPTIVTELEEHLHRALGLDPRHARALHMMGVLLRDVPWFMRWALKGSRSEIGPYLAAAVEMDPTFASARLDLGRHYRDTRRPAEARAQAKAVLDTPPAQRSRLWREKYRPAAEALLKSLPAE